MEFVFQQRNFQISKFPSHLTSIFIYFQFCWNCTKYSCNSHYYCTITKSLNRAVRRQSIGGILKYGSELSHQTYAKKKCSWSCFITCKAENEDNYLTLIICLLCLFPASLLKLLIWMAIISFGSGAFLRSKIKPSLETAQESIGWLSGPYLDDLH